MKLRRRIKLPKWLMVDTRHDTPRHIQDAIIQAAKDKRERRAAKWRALKVKP